MRRRWNERGQELVEFALVFPLLMLLVLGIIDFSVVVFSYNTIANAAREGVRYGIVNPDDEEGIEERVRDRALALNQATLEVEVTVEDPTIQVTVRYEASLMTGPVIDAIGGSPTLPLETAAVMRIEE
jgi:Flp pilus assembly protein TadG